MFGCVYDGLYHGHGSTWLLNIAGQTEGPLNTKGWVCGVAEKGSDWLGSYTGPHTIGSMDGNVRPVGNKDKVSYG